jgi:broad specificity phosphatase PhoE
MTVNQTIVFVRHGETDWNAEGRLQGQHDEPLNARGRAQALRNGQTIAEKIPEAAGYDFVASPLQRARRTMEIVRTAMGLDPKAYRLDPTLKELSFGRWEGFTYGEIEAREPGVLESRDANKWCFTPPGGESYETLSKRIVPFLDAINHPTVVVAHGGVGRVALVKLMGLDPEDSAFADFPQDKVFLWRGGAGTWL